jgi:HlyD family secretion protein
VVLERKRAQFAIAAPITGAVFGDDLPRMLGQYVAKGSEICRVADVRQLLVRANVGEEALADVRVGQDVRVKTRAFPDRVFRGKVSRIGGDSETDPNGHRSYRVELTIDNSEGLLRPGMTVFSRTDFGREPIGWLLAHKLRQALRPELWML